MNSSSSLMEHIARCQHALSILSDPERHRNHPCYKVVMSQFARQAFNPKKWQLAEPWVGNPATAKIVFLSSNPAFNVEELFPEAGDASFPLQAFFEERFQGEQFVRIDGHHFYVKDKKGHFYDKSVRFWNIIYQHAQRVLADREVVAGRDYLITEIVHCKSNREEGLTPHCIKTCRDTHLARVLQHCRHAKCFILVGSKALDWALPYFSQETSYPDIAALKARLQPPAEAPSVEAVRLSQGRALFWLPHPSSMIKNKGIITERQLGAIAAYLSKN